MPFWITSYIGSTFGLILVTILAVTALGAVAWFAKNWKLAVAAVVVLGLGFAYMQIDKNAYQRRVDEEAKELVKVYQRRIGALQLTAKANAEALAKDQSEINRLERLASETPPNTAACLDRDAARRVRSVR